MYVYYITVFILIFKCLLGNIVYCFKIFYVNYKNNELWYNKKCAIIYNFYVLLPGSKRSYNNTSIKIYLVLKYVF